MADEKLHEGGNLCKMLSNILTGVYFQEIYV